MKIAIIQIYNSNIKEYAEYSQLLNSLYAFKNNYSYISWNYDLIPLEYSVYYNKIIAVYKAMNEYSDIDWFLYLDSDAVVTNDTILIEDIIEQHSNKELILATDRNGQNNGVFLIKNTPDMQAYLKKCYEDSTYFHTKTPEQNAMFGLLVKNNKYLNLVGWEPAVFFNAYLKKYKDMQYDEPTWNDDSFILHLQKIDNNSRCDIFKQLLREKGLIYYTKN